MQYFSIKCFKLIGPILKYHIMHFSEENKLAAFSEILFRVYASPRLPAAPQLPVRTTAFLSLIQHQIISLVNQSQG